MDSGGRRAFRGRPAHGRVGRIAEVRTPTTVDPAVSTLEIWAAAGHLSSSESANYLTQEGYVECLWPGARSDTVPPMAHLDIADELSAQVFRMADAKAGVQETPTALTATRGWCRVSAPSDRRVLQRLRQDEG